MADDPFRIPAFTMPKLPSADSLVSPALGNIKTATARLLEQQAGAAKSMYERVVRQIADFEASLNPDEEIGARFVAAPGEGVVHIEDVGYWGPDMLIFHGRNAEGRPVQVVQHYTQLSITLTALPTKQPEPKRVGFAMMERLQSA